MKSPCISFCCPSCNSSFEVFLKKQPELMTFKCPTCKVALSFYDGQTTINDNLQEQLRNVKSQSEMTSIFNTLDRQVKSNSKEPLTDNDIIDFKIDLGCCKSFDEVLSLVCRT